MNTQKRYIEDRLDELEEEVKQLKEENISLKEKLNVQKKLITQLNERLMEISNFNERLRDVFNDSKISGVYDVDFSQNPLSPNSKNFPPRSSINIIKSTPTQFNYNQTNPSVKNIPQQNILSHLDVSNKSFVEEFNRLSGLTGRTLTDAGKNFCKENQVEALSCENFEARMNNPNLLPVFVEISPVQNGDFWAIPIHENIFAVLPNPRNSYNDNFHWERAMCKVFDSNFIQGKTYDKIQVKSPALFEKIGNTWTFREKGYLVLE